MSDYSELIGPGRWALIKSGPNRGQVVKVLSWDHGFEMWVVDYRDEEMFVDTDNLEPVFTMNQIVGVKLEEQQSGGDLMEKVKPFGLSSDDLAHYAENFIANCSNRIKGVGNQQYSEGGFQKFEAMDLGDLFRYIQEEIEDIPNYCTMLWIRMERLREALIVADIIEEEEEIPNG